MQSQPPKSTEEKLKRKAMIATAVVIVGHVAAFLFISNMKKDDQPKPADVAQTIPQPKTTALAKPSEDVASATTATATVASSPAETSEEITVATTPQPAPTNHASEQEIAKALANRPEFEINIPPAPNANNTTANTETNTTTTTTNPTPIVPVPVPAPNLNVATKPATPAQPATVTPTPATKPTLKVVDDANDMTVIEVRKPQAPVKPATPVQPKPTVTQPAVTAKATPPSKPTTPAVTPNSKTMVMNKVDPKLDNKTKAEQAKKATTPMPAVTAAKTTTVTTPKTNPVVTPAVTTTIVRTEPKKVEPKATETPAKAINKDELIKTIIVDNTPRQVSAAGVQWSSRPTFAKQDVAKYLGADSSVANVVVRMEADSKGTITHVSILQSSGNVQLDRYVLGQVKTSRVKPSAQPIITQLPFRLTTN